MDKSEFPQHFVRDKPLRESDLALSRLLLLENLLRKVKNMPTRSSSTKQPPTVAKLINSINFVTKLPMNIQQRKLRIIVFAMASIP